MMLVLQYQANRHYQCTAGNGIIIVQGIFSCFVVVAAPAEASDFFNHRALMFEVFHQCGLTAWIIPVGAVL